MKQNTNDLPDVVGYANQTAMAKAGMMKQAFGFGLVGLVATGIQYLVLHLLVMAIHITPALASAIGYAFSASLAYMANHRLVFRSERAHFKALPRFVAVAVTGLTINTLAIAFFLQHLPVHYLVAQVLATMVVFTWNFLANRFWTFAAA
jgi:putative flippase GtrA